MAPNVKDGYLMMFIYMPAVFGEEFTPYIGQIIVPILKVIYVYFYLFIINNVMRNHKKVNKKHSY